PIDIMRLFVGTGVLDRPRNLYKTNGSSRTPSPTTVKLTSTTNYNLSVADLAILSSSLSVWN
ncbi:MAG: hypothetical protein IKL16_02760, partial [Clostridia bacterium]|nr:hypothetical protein [Clostridia bacterium]